MSDTTTQHPDFDLMRRVLDEQDASLPEGWEDRAPVGQDDAIAQMQAAFGDLADPTSLYDTSMLAASGSLHSILPMLVLGLIDPVKAFAALWASAFLAGVRFQQAGGHTVAE
jgi:hypothetical protein